MQCSTYGREEPQHVMQLGVMQLGVMQLGVMSARCHVTSVSWQCLLDLPDIPVKAPRQAVKPVGHMTSVIDARNGILGRCDDNTGGGGGGEGRRRERGKRGVWYDYCMQCKCTSEGTYGALVA